MGESVYISVNRESHKENKRRILSAQESLLHSLKLLHNLQVLSRQKNDLKIRLQKSIVSIHGMIDLMILKIPNPEVPKKITTNNLKSSEINSEHKDIKLKRQDIEDELLLIREKLNALNS